VGGLPEALLHGVGGAGEAGVLQRALRLLQEPLRLLAEVLLHRAGAALDALHHRRLRLGRQRHRQPPHDEADAGRRGDGEGRVLLDPLFRAVEPRLGILVRQLVGLRRREEVGRRGAVAAHLRGDAGGARRAALLGRPGRGGGRLFGGGGGGGDRVRHHRRGLRHRLGAGGRDRRRAAGRPGRAAGRPGRAAGRPGRRATGGRAPGRARGRVTGGAAGGGAGGRARRGPAGPAGGGAGRRVT